MKIILVHWLIKPGFGEKFKEHWKDKMKIFKPPGFYREILTKPIQDDDPKYNTFSVTDKNYDTYINIAIWESVQHFDDAMQKLIPKTTTTKENDENVTTIKLKEFEFKLRERVVLDHIYDRGIPLEPPNVVDDE